MGLVIVSLKVKGAVLNSVILLLIEVGGLHVLEPQANARKRLRATNSQRRLLRAPWNSKSEKP